MNPALLERLQAVAAEAQAAGHGGKSAIYDAAAAEMGMSRATLLRKLKTVTLMPQRKRRCDAGTSALTREEGRMISAYILEASRNNGKRLPSLKDAVEVLRSNGTISAGRVDEETGEFQPMSEAAIGRAMRNFGLHPDQLARPTPKQYLKSKHPNHVWQIDPSLCVLYYLPAATGEHLQVMDEKQFYKNKPSNIRRVEKERVWRYVITDHASGWIYVHYVLGAESGKNLVEAFIGACQKRGADDPVHGRPSMVMVDPGSANTGAVFRNLCRALGVHLQVNEPGKPWAKGQVEKSNDIVERSFEHRIKFMRDLPQCLDDINEAAWGWMRWFNATRVHTRTNLTRYAAWLTITEDQLVIVPPAQVMRELAVHAPVPRKVSAHLTISYRTHTYSVADIPGVMVGEFVEVTRSPWHEDEAQVLYLDDDGNERRQALAPMEKGQLGFFEEAALLGEEYKAHADTMADTERKAIERLVTGASTDQEAVKRRKAKTVPFGGKVDPMKPITDTPLPDYLPKRGTDLDLQAPTVEALRLNHVQAAKQLRSRLGDEWRPEYFQWLQQRYPDGVPEDQLDSIAESLRHRPAAPLRIVGGDA